MFVMYVFWRFHCNSESCYARTQSCGGGTLTARTVIVQLTEIYDCKRPCPRVPASAKTRIVYGAINPRQLYYNCFLSLAAIASCEWTRAWSPYRGAALSVHARATLSNNSGVEKRAWITACLYANFAPASRQFDVETRPTNSGAIHVGPPTPWPTSAQTVQPLLHNCYSEAFKALTATWQYP